MENNKEPLKIDLLDVVAISLFATLFVLLVAFVLIAVSWDWLCAKIVTNALMQGAKQLAAP